MQSQRMPLRTSSRRTVILKQTRPTGTGLAFFVFWTLHESTRSCQLPNSNRSGNNSPTDQDFDWLMSWASYAQIMPSSSRNSLITCRHAPHGEATGWDTMTMRLNCRCPSETALAIATCSAQIQRLNEPFSTLQPVNILPSFVSSAAPTAKLE